MAPDEVKYDYVAGVSVGAYNASVLATFPPGQEKEAIDLLIDLSNVDTKEIFIAREPKYIAPFFNKSMMDNSGFVASLKRGLQDKPFVRKLSILATDMSNG